MSSVTRMGFEGKIYYGAAGSTASTEITNSRDITYGITHGRGETTTRGDGSAPPVETHEVTTRICDIQFQMLMKTSDTTLEALRTAAAAGTPVAIRTKDYSSGKGFDGDVTVECSHGKPYKGEQTLDFTCTPTDQSGRDPNPYT